MRRIISQAAKVIIWALLAVQVAVTGALLVGNVTNHQFMTVTGGSMEPTYHLGSAVLLDVSDRTPAVGEVVTFFSPDRTITTHRVVSQHDQDGELYLRTKGDANPEPDYDLINAKDVVGIPGPSAPYMGYVITWLTSPVGKLLTFGPVLAMIGIRETRKLIALRRDVALRLASGNSEVAA